MSLQQACVIILVLVSSARASHESLVDPNFDLTSPGDTAPGAYADAAAAAPHAPNRNALVGTTLRLGLFPFTLLPYVNLEPGCGIPLMQTFGQECTYAGGYMVELWDMITAELGATGAYHTDWSIVMRQTEPMGPRAFACLETRACDAVLFDYADSRNFLPLSPQPDPTSGAGPPNPFAAFPPQNTSSYAYTAPVWQDAWTGLVLQTRRKDSWFGALEPFGVSLWLALLIFLLVVMPALLVLLAVLTASAERPRKLRALPTTIVHSIYHSTAICLAGEDYVWHSGALRLLRLGLLIVVLVLQATYTANLAAIFTRPVFKTHGPASMEQLRSSIACTSYPAYGKYIKPHVREILTPPFYLEVDGVPMQTTDGTPIQTTDADRRAWCHARLIDRAADIWLEVESVARPILLRHCPNSTAANSLAIVPAIRFGPGAVGWAFRGEDAATAHAVSVAAIHAQQFNPRAILALNTKYLGAGQSCPTVDFAELARVDLGPMIGVFLAFAAFAGAGLLLGACQWVGRYRKPPGQVYAEAEEEGAAMTEGGMLRELLGKLGTVQKELAEIRTRERRIDERRSL